MSHLWDLGVYLLSGLTLAGVRALLKGQQLHAAEHKKIRTRLTIIECKLGIPTQDE